MEYQFYTADVFTRRPFQGAQIAVFPQAEGLDEASMAKIANELNLSETVFIFHPERNPKARRMRIFSPAGEIDFAGHPIIAAAYILAESGDIPLTSPTTPVELIQNKGPVKTHITVQDGKATLVQFTMKPEPIIDRFVPRESEICEFLGLPIQAIDTKKYQSMMVSCGFPYLIVPLNSYQAVRNARFDLSVWSRTTAPATSAQEILLFSAQTANPISDFHARLVGPRIGVKEDPPIGSSIPAFTSYLCAHPHVRTGTYTFAVDRGTESVRHSLLHIEMDNKGKNQLSIRVGGEAVLMAKGTMNVPATL
ncbi:MAG: PhzF family phenazine biosynthesis protein [Gammaproteobacteria bacterium]